jgi:hypothetical protein
MDSSWDNGGYGQAPKAGLPTWAKILLGCGVTAVLLVGGCVVGGAVLARRGFEKVASDPELQGEMARALWPEFKRIVEPLKDDEGARLLYGRQPQLAKRYPTTDAFLAATRPWQPVLGSLPEAPPPAEAFKVQVSFQGMALSYKPEGGKWLRLSVRGRSSRRHREDLRIQELEFNREAP